MNILLNKQKKDYNYISRYSTFPFYYHRLDKKYVYGTTSHIQQNIDYKLHKVKRYETLDSIALNYYNNPTYFWVIADFNKIQDPYTKLELGQELKIPTLNEIYYEETI